MAKTIVLQNHSFVSSVSVWVGALVFIPAGLFTLFAPAVIDKIVGLIFLLIIAILISNTVLKKYFFLKKGYASALQLTDDKLRIVYSYLSDKKVRIINLKDIKSFKVEIKAGRISKLITRGGSSSARVYKIKVIIETSKFSLEFFVHPNNTDPSSNLDFMYPLLDVSEKIPNFSYKIEGDSFLKEVLQDYIKSKI